jgi:peptidoglycan-associated lipoprotein
MLLGLALTVATAGCVKRPTPLTQLPGSPTPVANEGTQPPLLAPPVFNPGSGPGSGTPIQPGFASLADIFTKGVAHPEILQADTVYFDYDKSAIKGSEESKLADVANYLKNNAQSGVRVLGNCDERGTEEYNRSLGERRALAAREYLVGQGIDAARVDTISYGKDKPAVDGHDESAWSKNRRDDFVVFLPQ